MFDDGNHNDGSAGDGLYGCQIEDCSNSVDYYLYAENESSGVFSPARAAYEFYHFESNISSGDLVINEIMSNNISTAADPSDKFEDWIELYKILVYWELQLEYIQEKEVSEILYSQKKQTALL